MTDLKSVDLSALRPAGWEDVCQMCGMCCLVKVHDGADIFMTNIRCDRLDPDTGKCTCYNADATQRVDAGGGCIHAHNGSVLNLVTLRTDYVVPGACPYVKKYIGKNNLKMPKIDLHDTVPESQVNPADYREHILHGTWKLFKYNPDVNRRMVAAKGKNSK